MPYFQNPYIKNQPEICLGPDGRVTNIPPPSTLPITFEFPPGGIGTPIEGTPLSMMVVQTQAAHAMNLIAWGRLNYGADVPTIEG